MRRGRGALGCDVEEGGEAETRAGKAGVSPVSYFLEIAVGQDRREMVEQLTAFGRVHDDLEDGNVMIVISYLAELKAFQTLRNEWEAAGRARMLDMGG